jgi:hypothetical protein
MLNGKLEPNKLKRECKKQEHTINRWKSVLNKDVNYHMNKKGF